MGHSWCLCCGAYHLIEQKDWEDYARRSGDFYGKIYPANIILSEKGKGFCSMDVVDGNLILVHQCYGDGEHWVREIRKLAHERRIKDIRFITKRNPKAFTRKYGFKLEGYIMTIDSEEK